MALPKDDEMADALVSDRLNEAFREGIQMCRELHSVQIIRTSILP